MSTRPDQRWLIVKESEHADAEPYTIAEKLYLPIASMLRTGIRGVLKKASSPDRVGAPGGAIRVIARLLAPVGRTEADGTAAVKDALERARGARP